MTHEMKKMLDYAIERKDIESANAIMSLDLMSRQIKNALEFALIYSRKIEKKRIKDLFVEDVAKIEVEVNDLFEVLAGFLAMKGGAR